MCACLYTLQQHTQRLIPTQAHAAQADKEHSAVALTQKETGYCLPRTDANGCAVTFT